MKLTPKQIEELLNTYDVFALIDYFRSAGYDAEAEWLIKNYVK